MEAIELSKDSIINQRGFPSKNSGFYTREPYFAHLIRKARSLGFKIVSYDDISNIDRERTQALNLKKIIDTDCTAKIFVYAGVDHIMESNISRKWMAEHFKDLTNINPLTFSQDKITGKTLENIIILPSSSFSKVKKLNTNVDYFIINNLTPNLNIIYKDNNFVDTILTNDKLVNKNILIRVYKKNEYELIKKNAIPIVILNQQSKNSKVVVNLPVGGYFINILSDKNEELFDDFIDVH